MDEQKKINWWEIAVFYFVAVAVSAPFRLRMIQPEQTFPLPYGLNSLYSVLRGIGPSIGFVVVFYLLKSDVKRSLTFWGKSKYISLIAAAVIPVGMTIIGLPDSHGVDDHYLGFVAGITLFFYSIAEEFGWRGYLQEALAPMKNLYKVLLIATLWYVWHLNFLRPEISVQAHIVHYIFLVAGSWGLLKIANISLSILFASAVHLSFNILADAGGDFEKRMIVLTIAVVVWIVALRLIRKKAEEKSY